MGLKENIVTYYDQSGVDYLKGWGADKTMGMHFGFYDKDHRNHASAVINTNRVLAEVAGVKPKDRVLDAGCGIGGTSIWLANNVGCKVCGITLSWQQVATASKLAKSNRADKLTEFSVGDYTKTGFQDGSFDLIYGIESICHAEDKRDFLREAMRLLKNNGRLVVLDGFFKTDKKLSPGLEKHYKKWLEGWALPNLASVPSFRQGMDEAGFTDINYIDISKNVMPSLRRLYWKATFLYPLYRVGELFRLNTRTRTNGWRSGIYPYLAVRRGIATYGIFYGEKRPKKS